MALLEDDRGYRVADIIRDPKNPTKDCLINMSRSTWFKGIRENRIPKGQLISPRVRIWTGREIRAVLEGSGLSSN